MITKIGSEIYRQAGLILPGDMGAVMGYMRSSNLTPEQVKSLKKEHGLDRDANLKLRNAGRGALGDIAGGMAGGALGALLTGKRGGAILGGLGGGLLGGAYATKKYSPASVE